ncbi:MAG: peptidoglycan-binding protein [Clostridia bacterium]|nr:peptidoglycan-binding protein [Clostridia bacterium]
MQHTGLHIGGGKIIHCSTTVKEGKTTDKGWTHYAVPAGLYDGQETTTAEPVKVLATLRKGSQGSAVSALQTMLNRLGFDSGKVDGIYGTKTMAAVRSFQEANGLTVDGIAGEQTLTTLAIRAATLDSVPATPVTYTLTISGLDADTAARLMAEFPQAVKV